MLNGGLVMIKFLLFLEMLKIWAETECYDQNVLDLWLGETKI